MVWAFSQNDTNDTNDSNDVKAFFFVLASFESLSA